MVNQIINGHKTIYITKLPKEPEESTDSTF